MSPAEVTALRRPQYLCPKSRRQPKLKAGEVEFFDRLTAWRVPHEYESVFFPFDFNVGRQVSAGFLPDGRLLATRRRPECYLEIGLGGWDRTQRAITDQEIYEKMRAKKEPKIQKLYEHYGLRALLIDGPLYDAILHQPGGRQRFYDEIDAMLGQEWVEQLAA